MKSVLISINPKWCDLIASGKKTVEVRKTRPKISVPFKCFIYCTKPKMITKYVFKPEDYPEYMRPEKPVFCKVPDASSPFCSEVNGNGKVIGEFVCDFINEYTAEFVDDNSHEDIRQIFRETDGERSETIITSNEDDNPNNCYLCNTSCLSFREIREYVGCNFHEKPFYGWHISDLKIYDKPKELGEFVRECCGVGGSVGCVGCEWVDFYHRCCTCDNLRPITKPPQSWQYVTEIVHCIDCKHLEIEGCYGVCGKAYKGIVSPQTYCKYGERR